MAARRRRRLQIVVGAGALALSLPPLLFCLACGPHAYAPIVRSTHGGAGGSLEAGELAVGGATTTAQGSYWTGGPTLAYAVNDRLGVEAGAEIFMHGWALGYLGLRLTPLDVGGRWLRLVVDLEGGAGAGAGGILECDENDDDFDPDDPPYPACARPEEVLDWWRRWAVGWYSGVGLTVRAPYVAAFVRGRVQGSGAAQVPSTIWWSAVAGLAGDVLGWVDVYVAAGYAGFDAHGFAPRGWIVDMGLSVTVPVAHR